MKLLRHPVASLVLFAVAVTLLINIYVDIESSYGITKGDVRSLNVTDDYVLTEGNIMEQFQSMNLIEGMNDIEQAIRDLRAGTGFGDILGGLAGAGIGVVKTVVGLITAPYAIVNIIVTYYAGQIPGVLAGLITMIVVYVFFILLSAYLRSDI